MAGLTLDYKKLKVDPRFAALVLRFRDLGKSEGDAFMCLVRFWDLAQDWWGAGQLVPERLFNLDPEYPHLIASQFASRREDLDPDNPDYRDLPERGIYAYGSKERFNWYRQVTKAGESRAQNGARDERGRLTSQKKSSGSPAVRQRRTSGSPAVRQRRTSGSPAVAGEPLQPFTSTSSSLTEVDSENRGKIPPTPQALLEDKGSELSRAERDAARAEGDEAAGQLLGMTRDCDPDRDLVPIARAVLRDRWGTVEGFASKLRRAVDQNQDRSFAGEVQDLCRAKALLERIRAGPAPPPEAAESLN